MKCVSAHHICQKMHTSGESKLRKVEIYIGIPISFLWKHAGYLCSRRQECESFPFFWVRFDTPHTVMELALCRLREAGRQVAKNSEGGGREGGTDEDGPRWRPLHDVYRWQHSAEEAHRSSKKRKVQSMDMYQSAPQHNHNSNWVNTAVVPAQKTTTNLTHRNLATKFATRSQSRWLGNHTLADKR